MSKHPIQDVQHGFSNGYDPENARLIAATVSGMRMVNVYVPQGQTTESDKFKYKLNFFAELIQEFQTAKNSDKALAIMGDFNIAPNNDDVHDPDEWKDKILCSDQERKAFGEILSLGLHDSFRLFEKGSGFHSWWDYRAAAYRRGLGLRIDLLLASDELKTACKKSYIDEKPRSLEKPSDHTPVVIEIS